MPFGEEWKYEFPLLNYLCMYVFYSKLINSYCYIAFHCLNISWFISSLLDEYFGFPVLRHLAMTGEPLGFSLVAVGYLSYHREFMLPLVLAHKSLIFHSRFEEELEVHSSHCLLIGNVEVVVISKWPQVQFSHSVVSNSLRPHGL